MTRLVGLLLVSLLLIACSDGDGGDEPNAGPSATPFPTSRAGSTAVPGETAVPPAQSETPVAVLELTGVFPEPREVEVASTVELAERPASPFEAWDGVSVVIYDTESGEAHDFGPGALGDPAFGADHLVYTVDNKEVYVVDLRTMEKRLVAEGILAYFLGDDHIVINPGDNAFYAYDLRTDRRVELANLNQPLVKSMASSRWGGVFRAKWVNDRFAIRQIENPQVVCEATGPEQRACVADASSHWLIEDVWGLEVKLVIDANKVEPGGNAEVVIATTPVCEEAGELTDCYEVLAKLEAQNPGETGQLSVDGTTNIFTVDLITGEATFVATATYNAATGEWPMSWPLVANGEHVVWTESYCGNPAGMTRIYDRATGEISELTAREWLVLADGRLGLGERGATTVIDPSTHEYLAVLPELASVSWSKDLRYAAVGQGFARGGVCD